MNHFISSLVCEHGIDEDCETLEKTWEGCTN